MPIFQVILVRLYDPPHPLFDTLLIVRDRLLRAGGGPTEFSHMRYTAATCDPNDFTPEVSARSPFHEI